MLKVGLPGVGLSSRKSLRLDINIYDNDIVLTVLSVESIFSHHQRSETVQVNCLFLSTDIKKTIVKCPGWMFNIYKPKICPIWRELEILKILMIFLSQCQINSHDKIFDLSWSCKVFEQVLDHKHVNIPSNLTCNLNLMV